MKLHRMIAGISILLLLPVLCLQAFAAGVSGTLNLSCSTRMDGERFYIAGDEFSLVKIADAEVIMSEGNSHIRYTVLSKYESLDCDWENLTAEESHAKAKQLASMVTVEECMVSAVTDWQGKTSFENLAPAMYLVVRTKVAPQNESYDVDPFLVSAPLLWDGNINYTITASPKCGWTPEEPDHPVNPSVPPEPHNPDKPEPDDPKLPQTGQLQWPIPVLLVVGSILIMIGWKKYRQQ